MLDEQMELMLRAAEDLTAEDLDFIGRTARGEPPTRRVSVPVEAPAPPVDQTDSDVTTGPSQGERERRRTRESKVSTGCVGEQRARHEWWPVGTELTGTLGSECFTGVVVENPRVKSGRGILIMSGTASGKVCNTPTRAAIEATEAYRRANNLGRGGGVTNGWTFWKPANK